MDKEISTKLKKVEMEILRKVHSFCTDNGIKYSLSAGTLLGAVRNKGFIPWDIDIDIMMDRENYERFINLWLKNPPEGYILQNKATNHDYSQTFTKIRKDGTTFLQQGEENKSYHKGIALDIFPLDRIGERGIKRFCDILRAHFYLLYSRGFAPRDGAAFVRFAASVFLAAVPESERFALSEKIKKKLLKRNADKSLPYTDYASLAGCKRRFDKNLFKELELTEFENEFFYATKLSDEFLREVYGDYKNLPPESERVNKHKPVIVNFEKNYEELG